MEGDIKIVSQIYPPSQLPQISNISTNNSDSSTLGKMDKINTGENASINDNRQQSSTTNGSDNNRIHQTHPMSNPSLPFKQTGSGVSMISPTQGDIDRAEEMIKLKHIDPKLIKKIQSILGRGAVNNSKGKKKKSPKSKPKSKSKSKSKSSKSSKSKGKKKSKPKTKSKAKKSKPKSNKKKKSKK